MSHPGRWMALVARTPADARDYNVEGPGGILRNVPPRERPNYEPSKRRLTWPNRSWATIYSDEEPDQLRGFSGDSALLDEFAKWKHSVECWDNLAFGMRELGNDRPRTMITTTPRPLAILKRIEAMADTVLTIGSSYENSANLDPEWFTKTLARYEGTRTGRQEIHAEILDDVQGALWTIDAIDEARVKTAPPMQRVVVGVDPSGTSGADDGANSVGIVAAGKGVDGRAYVLADATCSLSPAGWALQVSQTFKRCEADRVVAEKNFGGAMVEAVLRTANKSMPVRLVNASRGKVARAEPVAALYEQGRVSHVGALPELEDQMIQFTGDGYVGEASPDRADALVWALTELMLGDSDYDISRSWVG